MRFLQQNWKHDSWFKERYVMGPRHVGGRKTLGAGSPETTAPYEEARTFPQVLGTGKACLPPLDPSKLKQPLSVVEARVAAGWGASPGQGGSRRPPGERRGAGAMPAATLLASGCSPLSARAGSPQLAFKCLSEDSANSHSVFTASQRVLACSRLLAAPEPVAYRWLKRSLIFQKAWESYLPVGEFTAMYFTYIHFTVNGGLRHYGNKNMIFEPCGSLMSCTLKTQ